MTTPADTDRKRYTLALVAAGVGLVALLVWLGAELVSPRKEKIVADAAPAAAQRPPPALPPLRPLPADAGALPPLRALPPGAQPSAAQDQKPPPAPPPGSVAQPAAPPRESNAPQTAARGGKSEAAQPAAAKSDPAGESLRGKYVGNVSGSFGSETVGMTLVISESRGGSVTAVATLGGTACRGDYPMKGTYRLKSLQLRATRNGGPTRDCPLALALTVDGGRLAGTTQSGEQVQLRR